MTPLRRLRRLGLVPACAVLVLWPERAAGQDFSTPAPPWPPATPSALLERGLPPPAPGVALELALVRWYGLDDLASRAVSVGGGWRSARVACGFGQTGDREVGWNTLAIAGGVAQSTAGAAVRAVARRDRVPSMEVLPRDWGAGIEIGAGAWVEAGHGVHVWALVPQLWTDGAAPPLDRGLELGAGAHRSDLGAWFTRTTARAGSASRGEHAAGVAAYGGPLTLWLAMRDRPFRGGVGVAGRLSGLQVAIEAESHPVLGQTLRLTAVVGSGGAP